MKVLITGGAGFVGCNAAARYRAAGHRVVVLDNLSRLGAESNLDWLGGLGSGLEFVRADIRDAGRLECAFADHKDTQVVLHLAAQVAVSTSVRHPREDFEINALGSFNVLEAARSLPRLRALLFASTNKVYGAMENVAVADGATRYAYASLPAGVPESQPLDFHSPYGCSKGAADQYTLDYARIYGLPAVVFRQSCIYGPRQFGVEDQGWVAWFCIAAALGRPITIFGDGKQVRDVLYVDDLLRAFDLATERVDRCAGRAYNLGGGPDNTLSLLELLDYLAESTGRAPRYTFSDWRPGDQKIYISDIRRAREELGWSPACGVREGLARLQGWVQQNLHLFEAGNG